MIVGSPTMKEPEAKIILCVFLRFFVANQSWRKEETNDKRR